MGVMFRAIQCKVRKPNGLFLIYPALILDMNVFLPSHIRTLTDEIVPFSILEVCIRSYLPPYTDAKQLYISPGLCRDQ